MNRIVTIEATSSGDVSDIIFSQVKMLIEPKGWEMDRISVSQPQAISAAASIVLESCDYDGIICIGAFHHDDRYETKALYQEFLRSMNEISVHFAIPVGIAVLYLEKDDDVQSVINNSALRATESCDELMKLKNLYQSFNHDGPKEYKN